MERFSESKPNRRFLKQVDSLENAFDSSNEDSLEKTLRLKIQKTSSFFREFDEMKDSLFGNFASSAPKKNSSHEKVELLSKKLKNTMNFIFWKHTPENNKNHLQSGLHFFNDKNLQKFEASWLYEFNIGNVMYLKKIGLDKFQPGSQFDFFNDVDFLIDLLLFLR